MRSGRSPRDLSTYSISPLVSTRHLRFALCTRTIEKWLWLWLTAKLRLTAFSFWARLCSFSLCLPCPHAVSLLSVIYQNLCMLDTLMSFFFISYQFSSFVNLEKRRYVSLVDLKKTQYFISAIIFKTTVLQSTSFSMRWFFLHLKVFLFLNFKMFFKLYLIDDR